MNNTTTPWLSLENLPHLTALASVWRSHAGPGFDAFSRLCLDVSPEIPEAIPCPIAPGCYFDIHGHCPGRVFGKCAHRVNRPPCLDSDLSEADLAVLQVNCEKLGRAICKAFGLNTKFRNIDIVNVAQIGTWSVDEVPVMLSIQPDYFQQHLAVAELVATLAAKFILFAPTSRTMDVHCTGMLNRVGAQFFPLDVTTTLTPHGTLLPTRTPGELFARFTPQPKETDRSVAERAFALVQQLDLTGPKNRPSVMTVFRMYCIEEMSAETIAKKCHCSKAAIVRRLISIRNSTRQDPKDLRRLSAHLDSHNVSREDIEVDDAGE